MKEILGYNLECLLKESDSKCTYKGKEYEVWEVSDLMFDFLDQMKEEEFEFKCPEGWWRWSSGCVLDDPIEEFIINGKSINAWNRKEHDEYFHNDYPSLTEYMCSHVGASQPSNVCALAADLVKYNDITMGELFMEYEGVTID